MRPYILDVMSNIRLRQHKCYKRFSKGCYIQWTLRYTEEVITTLTSTLFAFTCKLTINNKIFQTYLICWVSRSKERINQRTQLWPSTALIYETFRYNALASQAELVNFPPKSITAIKLILNLQCYCYFVAKQMPEYSVLCEFCFWLNNIKYCDSMFV